MAPEEGWGGGGGGPDCEVGGIRRRSVSCEYAAGNVIQEPVDTQQEVLAGDGTTALDAPMVAVDGVQFQGLERRGSGRERAGRDPGDHRPCHPQPLPLSWPRRNPGLPQRLSVVPLAPGEDPSAPQSPWALCTPPDQHYPSVTAQHLLWIQEHLLGSRPCALCHTNVLPSIPSKSQGATGIAGHFMEENTSERSSNLSKVTQLVREPRF